MKLHRFFLSERFRKGEFELADATLARQIQQVLRLKPGEDIMLADGKGSEARATIRAFSPEGAVELTVGEVHPGTSEPSVGIDLYVAILKRENFEWVVQKGTEVGVARFIPIISARTIKLGLKHERLVDIAREAAEQSGRSVMPEILEPVRASEVELRGSVYLLDPGRGNRLAVDADDMAGYRGALIGPEGGWTEEEALEFEHAGAIPANLGPLTLRAETAAIIAGYLLASGG